MFSNFNNKSNLLTILFFSVENGSLNYHTMHKNDQNLLQKCLWSVDGNFSNKIFFSDGAHFIHDGYVNKQNYRIWGCENPQVIEERPLHPDKVTVWYAFWSEGVFG